MRIFSSRSRAKVRSRAGENSVACIAKRASITNDQWRPAGTSVETNDVKLQDTKKHNKQLMNISIYYTNDIVDDVLLCYGGIQL